MLWNVNGNSAPSISTFKMCAAEFKHDHTSVEDDPREGWSEVATTPETVETVYNVILD